MATKDWKKGRKNLWENGLHTVEILNDIHIEIFNGETLVISKSFKTKTQALKYARAYMRKH